MGCVPCPLPPVFSISGHLKNILFNKYFRDSIFKKLTLRIEYSRLLDTGDVEATAVQQLMVWWERVRFVTTVKRRKGCTCSGLGLRGGAEKEPHTLEECFWKVWRSVFRRV